MIMAEDNHCRNRAGEEIKAKEQKATYKHCPRSHQVIIFIHGIIEGPKQFRRMAQIAYQEGYSIYMLLLPGHGRSGKAFARADYKQWITYVSWEIKKMKACYKEIILVGHSMGALFSLCEAVNFPCQIKALVLLDTPLCLRLWPRVLIGAVKIKNGQIYDDYTKAEANAISIRRGRGCHYIRWLVRYCELFSLIRFTRKQIKWLKQPVFLVFAKKDEFVCLKSRRYFYQISSQVEEMILEDSGHFSYHHEDLISLEMGFREFISKQKEV